jgi:hypothetical protein
MAQTIDEDDDGLPLGERLFLAFADAEELPAAAMAEAAARWGTCGDFFVEVLRGYASGELDPTADGDAPTILLHLVAQVRDTRAFLPLIGLLRQDGETLEAALGDVLTETLPRILVAVFDGDPTALEDLTADPGTDPTCRWSAIDAYMALHLHGAIDAARAQRLLARIADSGLAPDDMGWIGWLKGCALLDDAGLDARARLLIADGRIAPLEYGAAEFDAARAERAANAERLREETAPITDAAALLAQWYGYTEAGIAARRKAATLGLSVGRDTHVNPFRGIGRNDPCPCGSGRKFKKCHGA